MTKLQGCLLLVALIVGVNALEVPKPSYARTFLKVSRSLPGETEELKVRTSEGNLATLIVKRREKSSSILEDAKNREASSKEPVDSLTSSTENESVSVLNNSTRPNEDNTKTKNEIRRLEDAQVQRIRAKFSKSVEQKIAGPSENTKQNLNTPTVIDYGNWTPLGEDGRALKLEDPNLRTEEYHSWKPLRPTSKTILEKRVDYPSHQSSEFNDKVTLLLPVQNDRGQRNLELEDRLLERNDRQGQYTFLSHQLPRNPPIRTNIGANLMKNRDAKNVPPEVVVRSEINVKSSPKRAPMSVDSDGTPVIHGKRVPDEPIDKIQTWRNARVINNKLIVDGVPSGASESGTRYYSADGLAERQRFERFFKDVNRSRYGRNFGEEGRNVYFEWDPNNYKNEALKAEVYEARNDNYRSNLHKRMLHPEAFTTYPTSQLYTPESQKTAAVALKTGTRAPVLQYAHPELGVQSAKILKNEKRRPETYQDIQHPYMEQRQKKKYVLNDKNIVDSYTTKDYYPNQHFYGLKKPNDAPFWVKISENLKNQFSTGVEKVSQFTKPVFDPLVEATHKISQNLGLSKGKEAQDKIGTVASGTSILIPALGLVASGAALGIGAVAVGRYLDVDVLKRSNEGGNLEVLHERALVSPDAYLNLENMEIPNQGEMSSRSLDRVPETLYLVENEVPANREAIKSAEHNEGVLLVLEEDPRPSDGVETRESKPIVEERSYVDTTGAKPVERRKRSLDFLDVFKAEADARNLVRSKRLQRKGADSISEIVEIDLPVREGSIGVTELLIPRKNSMPGLLSKDAVKDGTILVVEDGTMPVKVTGSSLEESMVEKNALENVAKMIEEVEERSNEVFRQDSSVRVENERRKRRRRSLVSDQELDDALQNLENAEVAEVAHINGDWTNTPCAKRIFCDAMIQRGHDAAIFMEKKMAALLGLIQPGAAVQVSNHFQEVMEAVRRHDCSSFLCPQARPGNVFF